MPPAPRPWRVVLMTAPDARTARRLAKALVRDRLAACVNIIPAVESHYRWEGKLQLDSEAILLVKTRSRLMGRLLRFVKARHPYRVPEVIGLAIQEGSPAYLAWLEDSLARP